MAVDEMVMQVVDRGEAGEHGGSDNEWGLVVVVEAGGR